MNYRMPALILLTVPLFTAPAAFANRIGSSISTAIGPGFDLVTANPGPVQLPALPGVEVALDPAACASNCGISFLDVGNAANPVLLLPAIRPQQNFSILWGMASPGPTQFVFNLPATPPDANGDYAWSATGFDITGNQIAAFQGVFHLVTSSPINPASWVIAQPGPTQNSFQINFSTMAASNADLGFTLSENSTPLSFSALIGPNIKTAIGPGFDLVTSQPGPIQLPSLPGVEVALDPAACASNCGISFLDGGNAANPVLLLPAIRPQQNFSILWGMSSPGPVQFVFNLPATPPDANGDYAWSATEFDVTGNQIATFQGVFHLVTSSPINPASWVIAQPGPQQNSLEINFSTMAASNADLGFTLSENSTPLSFSALIDPNIKTAIGPGYGLVTTNPGPVQLPALPGISMALDPAACAANCGISFLDVGNAANPVLLLPAIRPQQNFSILWGMNSPGPVQFVFNLPATPPDANGDYAWSATGFDITGNQIATFQGVFHLVTSSPINPASWIIAQPGPVQNSFEINFSTMAASNADLGFTLSENRTPLSFSALIGPNN